MMFIDAGLQVSPRTAYFPPLLLVAAAVLSLASPTFSKPTLFCFSTMKYSLTWAALSASLSWAATFDPSASNQRAPENIISNAYIVEIDPSIVGISSITGKRSITPHAGLYEAMHKRDITWSTTHEYAGDLFNGAAVRLNVSHLYMEHRLSRR
jgi:hypothetical protein